MFGCDPLQSLSMALTSFEMSPSLTDPANGRINFLAIHYPSQQERKVSLKL
jgi:hypothetical protein